MALEVPCRVNEPLAADEPLILGIIGVPLIIVCGVVWSKRRAVVGAVVEVAALPPMDKLVTGVVEITENGAVPVAKVLTS